MGGNHLKIYKKMQKRLKSNLTSDGKLTIEAVVFVMNLLIANLFMDVFLILLIVFLIFR
jgi:hypothetical protein